MNSKPEKSLQLSRAALAVVIVSYNSAVDIEQQLPELRSAGTDLVIVVVDNDSSHPTKTRLRKLYADGRIDHFIQNSYNAGFAKAVNIGIAAVPDLDIALLNPDARITAVDLKRLQHRTNADESTGIGAPLVLTGRGVAVMAAGEQPTLWPMFTHFSGLARLFPTSKRLRGRHLYLKNHSRDDQSVGWASGCCLLIPRTTINAIGYLSERWFMYGEDIEYARRVIKSGRKVMVYVDIVAHHEIGAATRSRDSPVASMWAQNTYDYYCNEYRPGAAARILWRLIFTTGLLGRSFILALRSRVSRNANSANLSLRAESLTRYALDVWKIPRKRDYTNTSSS